MNKKEILESAIKKALKNGWKDPEQISLILSSEIPMHDDFAKNFIFNHDFAKAFWGEESEVFYVGHDPIGDKDVRTVYKNWEGHLKQMVTSEDPILYLEQFL